MTGAWELGSRELGSMNGTMLLAGGFVALCLVLWLLWRWLGRARAAGQARAELAAATHEELRNDIGVETSGRVMLFTTYPAESQVAVESKIHPIESTRVTAANENFAPDAAAGVSELERRGERVHLPAVPKIAGAEAVAAPVRRRPRPAWELAVDGQTPASLLAKAHELLTAGADGEAADQLRACAQLASKLKEVGVEAVARLELGDLARSHGDMTTACEHWQLARSLYAELKRPDDVTAAVKRMEKAGCPTDWVLTKF